MFFGFTCPLTGKNLHFLYCCGCLLESFSTCESNSSLYVAIHCSLNTTPSSLYKSLLLISQVAASITLFGLILSDSALLLYCNLRFKLTLIVPVPLCSHDKNSHCVTYVCRYIDNITMYFELLSSRSLHKFLKSNSWS